MDKEMCVLIYTHMEHFSDIKNNEILPLETLWMDLEDIVLPYPWRFSRQEYWSGLPCFPPGDLYAKWNKSDKKDKYYMISFVES